MWRHVVALHPRRLKSHPHNWDSPHSPLLALLLPLEEGDEVEQRNRRACCRAPVWAVARAAAPTQNLTFSKLSLNIKQRIWNLWHNYNGRAGLRHSIAHKCCHHCWHSLIHNNVRLWYRQKAGPPWRFCGPSSVSRSWFLDKRLHHCSPFSPSPLKYGNKHSICS